MSAVVLPESSSPRPARFLFRSFDFPGAALLLLVLALLAPAPGMQGQTLASLSPTLIPDRIFDRIDDSNLTTIHGSTHPAARNAIDNGRLPPSTEVGDLILVLTRSEAQQTALESLNKEQYDPASPRYHQWLTPEQFGTAYGLSQSDLNAVVNWLQDHGFTIQEIPPSRTSIRFSGSAAQVETAFHTEMHSLQSNGVSHVANTSDIQIPAALSPVVAGVKALHNYFPKPQHHAPAPPIQNILGESRLQPAANLLQPAGQHTEYNPNDGYQLLVPYDMATIYNYKSLWAASTPITGASQTIAIAGTSNIVLSDVATFRAATGLPANVPKVIVTNTNPGVTALLDDRFENTLDVEWSGAAAPGASIVLVTSSQTTQTTDALYASESYIINNNVAKIMSVSYGECELGLGTAGNQEYLNLWQQAYTQGIAVFVSSGDSAAAVCDDGNNNSSVDYAAEFGTTVSGMTSTPYNVSVGGTDFAPSSSGWSQTNNSANMSSATGYIAEIPWNNSITNPYVISSMNSQHGVNYNAEQWANWLLKNDGVNSSTYQEFIPPVGGSGGVSNCTTSSNDNPSTCGGGYAKPAWQTGVAGILSSDKRAVPDVSFFASNGFMGVAYLICDTQPPGYSAPIACTYPANALDMAVGGTSVSSPVMAGVMALINQKAGSSQGNPNAQLYALAAKQTYANCKAETVVNSSACYFNDIDTGTIATPCFAGSVNCTPQTAGDKLAILPGYAATTGYDKATGLGSLNVANVVNGWPGVTPAAAPVVNLNPASLAFASTNVSAASTSQTVTLKNTGNASLTLSSVSITGANPSSFLLTNNCGATLAVNAACTLSISFKPAAAGALTASLSLATNAAGSPQTVPLSGTGVATATASVSPASLTFPSTAAGAVSASQTVTFTNTGSSTLASLGVSLTGTNSSAFKGNTTCGVSLAAGASCTVTFTFNPSSAGSFTAQLSFTSTTANYTTKTVPLAGTGIAAVPAATPSLSALNFPVTAISSNSAINYSPAQAVTLTNSGNSPLTISAITLGGSNPTSFSQMNNCPASLATAASCTALVRFNPTATGSKTATLVFTDNASPITQSIALNGTGGSAPTFALSLSTLSFGSIQANSGESVQAVTLTNSSATTPLYLTSFALSGTGAASFTQLNSCGTTLAASSTCTLLVQFAPNAKGAQSATLTVTSNNPTATATVALSGTGQ